LAAHLHAGQCGHAAREAEVGRKFPLSASPLYATARGLETWRAHRDQVVSCARLESHSEATADIGGGLTHQAVGAAGDGDVGSRYHAGRVIDDAASHNLRCAAGRLLSERRADTADARAGDH
jgi:hypothetical protein